MAKGGRMCCFGSWKDSLIGRVLDECGSGPKKIVGTVSATSEASPAAMDCDRVRPSAERSMIKAVWKALLHVRFGVGAGGEILGVTSYSRGG